MFCLEVSGGGGNSLLRHGSGRSRTISATLFSASRYIWFLQQFEKTVLRSGYNSAPWARIPS